jgi:hypothetical protein
MRIPLGTTQQSAEVSRIGTTVLQHHEYELAQTSGSAAFYYEPHWKDRVPFDDVSALGATAAQTRIIIQGNDRPAAGMGRVLVVELVAHNRVRMKDGDGWTTIPATKAYTAYIKEIANEMKRELDTGIKVY